MFRRRGEMIADLAGGVEDDAVCRGCRRGRRVRRWHGAASGVEA